jgi:hypothetical protein
VPTIGMASERARKKIAQLLRMCRNKFGDLRHEFHSSACLASRFGEHKFIFQCLDLPHALSITSFAACLKSHGRLRRLGIFRPMNKLVDPSRG